MRRPGGRPASTGRAGGAGRALEPDVAAGDEPEEIEELEEELPASATVSLEEYRVVRPVEPDPVVSTPRRARERGRQRSAVRTGPTSMDVAARNYSHIRGDLIRIAIIAMVMFGVIVALSFVLK